MCTILIMISKFVIIFYYPSQAIEALDPDHLCGEYWNNKCNETASFSDIGRRQ